MKKETAQKLLKQTKFSYSQIAQNFDATRNYLWPEFDKFLKYVKPNDKILDLGCGNGRLVKLFENIKINYTGIDNNNQLIKLAKKHYPNKKFLVGDALSLPFKNNEFDVIFFIAVLHHLPGKFLREKAMREIKKILKPGGVLIMANWNLFHCRVNKKYNYKFIRLFLKFTLLKLIGKSNLDFKDAIIPWDNSGIGRYYHYFTITELKSLVKKSGFKIIDSSKSGNLVIIAKN